MEEPPYRNREWLYEQYVEQGRTITDIADELGIDHTTVSKWRRRLDIPKPSRTVDLECPVCGDGFTRTLAKVERAKHANVCSRECLYAGRSEGIIGREVDGGYDTSETVHERACPACGETFDTTASEDYKHCSRRCFLDTHAERMAGDGNPAYVDGAVRSKRCDRGPHWARERKQAYKRDDYTCQRCERKCISRQSFDGTNGGRLIQAHHIDGYESPDDNTLDNLITLCARCHGAVGGGAPLNVGGAIDRRDTAR